MTETLIDSRLAWIPLLPFIGFLVNGLLGKRMGPRFVSWIGCLAPIASFAVVYSLWNELTPGIQSIEFLAFRWIEAGDFNAPMEFRFDRLSAVMCLVVTGVGSLIHLYSTGYMKGDKSYWRFFAYLNLFTALMLVLVLGANLLVIFVGWEGVGLSSYLLIGFWHHSSENASAGRKAFLFNRVGDFGFLIGIFLLYGKFGTIDCSQLIVELQRIPLETLDVAFITTATLFLFLGATGKSAQIPLFPWLPDAMAGPTPVSALIHAATMVTSGVYLCCRMEPFFAASATTMAIIAAVGATTALLAALIALTQNDIKKVLAYSTVSQLGYMFYAIGCGAFGAALFHVVTHAFFKALLFLGSGSVIHAVHHEQDMRKMGGLREQLPFTHLMFIVGTAAIAGVPIFAGFFSKDEILFSGFLHAFHGDHTGLAYPIFWVMSFLTAGLTAFYMLRLVALTFWGESRVDEKVVADVREPGGWMPFVLLVLGVLSIFGGLLSVPDLGIFGFVEPQILTQYVGLYHPHAGDPDEIHTLEYISMALSVGIGVLGLALAYFLYGAGKSKLDAFTQGAGRGLVKLSENKFYVDELYDNAIIRPFVDLSHALWLIIDRYLIDKFLVDGSALVARTTGEFFRRMQSGFIPAYLLTFGCGALVLLFVVLRLLKESA